MPALGAGGVPLGEGLPVGRPVQREVEHLVVVAAVDELPGRVGVRERVGRDEVAPAQLGRVELELARRDVEQALHREVGLGLAEAAERPERGLVGHHRGGRDVDRRHRVRTAQQRPGRPSGAGATGRRRAAEVDQVARAQADDPPVGVEAELQVHPLRARRRRGDEGLVALLDEAHRATQLQREVRDQRLLRVHHGFHAERAADIRGDHPDPVLRQTDSIEATPWRIWCGDCVEVQIVRLGPAGS